MPALLFGSDEARELLSSFYTDRTIDNADNKKILINIVSSNLPKNSVVRVVWTDFNKWSNSKQDFRKDSLDKSNIWFYEKFWTEWNKIQINTAIIDYAWLHLEKNKCKPEFFYSDDSIIDVIKTQLKHAQIKSDYLNV